MLIYLLKFSACLAILLLFYKLVLEQVHIHHFKRYYLLSAFIISLGIPLITFTQYVTVTVEPMLYAKGPEHNYIYPEALPQAETNILPILLWSLYILGLVLFALKFFANLRSLHKSIKNNPKRKSGRIHHVLLQELIAPHTFFSYIFFNKKNYKEQRIPQEVFWHEETHAQQKHSFDIIVLELLQIVFWFHPLVYWAKHLVKLNHEFLADQAVLKNGASIPNYQNLVLAFSSNAVAPPLANAIHYSSIKKRIVIMKTQTSQKAIWLKNGLLIPLLALLFYGFSEKTQMEIYAYEKETITSDEGSFINNRLYNQTKPNLSLGENWQPTEKDFKIWKENEGNFLIYIHEEPVNTEELNKYSPADFYHFSMKFVPWKNRQPEFPQPYKLHLYTQEEFEKIPKLEFGKIHIQINKNGQLLVNDQSCNIENLADRLQELQTDFDRNGKAGRIVSLAADDGTSQKTKDKVQEIIKKIGPSSWVSKNDVPEMDTLYTYNKLAKRIKTIPINRKANIIYLREIYTKMSGSQRNQVLHPNSIVENMNSQEGATKTEIQEFNTLAKKYNAQPQKTRVIPLKDLKTLENIYGSMTDSQKKEAEPFPECAPPPPPNPAPAPKLVPTIKKGEPSPIPPVPTPPKTETKVDHEEELGNNNHISRKVVSKAKIVPVVSSDFPPPPPTIATHVNTENYSKEVKYAINTYLKKAKSYRAAVSRYHNEHKGSIDELKKNYVEVMQFYDTYKKLAYKENHYVHPVPLYNDPNGEFGKPNSTFDDEEDNIPSPTLKSSANQKLRPIKEPSVFYGNLYAVPQPPAQKNPDPVEYIKALAEKGATFYIGPHQYQAVEAIELVRNSQDASIDVSNYPVVKLGGC